MSDVPLKEYFEALRADDKEALHIALQAADTAVNKAEAAQKAVNQGQNEFRAQQKDLIATMLPRNEYESNHKALEDKIDALTDRFNVREGRSGGLSAGWGYLVGAIGLLGSVVGIIIGTR